MDTPAHSKERTAADTMRKHKKQTNYKMFEKPEKAMFTFFHDPFSVFWQHKIPVWKFSFPSERPIKLWMYFSFRFLIFFFLFTLFSFWDQYFISFVYLYLFRLCDERPAQNVSLIKLSSVAIHLSFLFLCTLRTAIKYYHFNRFLFSSFWEMHTKKRKRKLESFFSLQLDFFRCWSCSSVS